MVYLASIHFYFWSRQNHYHDVRFLPVCGNNRQIELSLYKALTKGISHFVSFI